MTTTFSEPPRDFGASDEAASRYTKQLAALEQRCQSAAQDIQSWRLMTFGMTGVSVAAIAACLYIASLQPTPAVHVVEIDSKTGETVRQQVIGEPIPVDDVMVSHMIGRWIQLTRGKSIDPVVLKSHWEQAYQFVPVEAKAQIDAYAREIDAFNPDDDHQGGCDRRDRVGHPSVGRKFPGALAGNPLRGRQSPRPAAFHGQHFGGFSQAHHPPPNSSQPDRSDDHRDLCPARL